MSINMDDAGYWNSPEQCEAENKALRKDAERFQYLQNCDQKIAQAFFWNYSSRKARAKAIDAAMKKKMTNREFSADLLMAPKKVKRKRYINVYPDEWQRGDVIYMTKELADTYAYTHRIACVEVEYEFEV